MPIIFGPAKAAANKAKHGLSLADAEGFDFTSAIVVIDDHRDYGETRYLAFAMMGRRGYCFVFTVVDEETIRAISYRRARTKELKRYGL